MYHKIKSLVQSSFFQNFIMSLIVLNGITLGLETSKEIASTYKNLFFAFDKFVITIFTIEIILRIYVYRRDFFKDGWSIFDLIIVVISFAPDNASFAVFRILRVFRLLRLITVVPQMRKIVSALIGVIPGLLSIAALLGLLFYISAIIATNLYGERFPQWFGTLGESFYTLFQIMTLESWSMGIVRPVMEVYPYAWVFFIPFIFIVTFIMINLIIAIVVDAMTQITKDEQENIANEIRTNEEHLTQKINDLQKEIEELKSLIISSKN